MNLNLIGMRGVGKSNVARRLSVLTKMPVMATDVLVEYETGMTIPDFISEHNGDWRAFRDLEFEVLKRLGNLDGLIIDCGGGIMVEVGADGREVYSERKVAQLRQLGPVVWLQGDIARLAAKTAGDPTRPSLHAAMGAQQIMRRREPWYDLAADYRVFVERGLRQEVAEHLAVHFGFLEPAASPN